MCLCCQIVGRWRVANNRVQKSDAGVQKSDAGVGIGTLIGDRDYIA